MNNIRIYMAIPVENNKWRVAWFNTFTEETGEIPINFSTEAQAKEQANKMNREVKKEKNGKLDKSK
jgi:hypothetical protein